VGFFLVYLDLGNFVFVLFCFFFFFFFCVCVCDLELFSVYGFFMEHVIM
jgi:hypothetical protein